MHKVLILSAVILFLASSCSITPKEDKTITPTLAATAVTRHSASGGLIAEGRVVPLQHAALSMASAGVVAELLVKEGETVQANQVLLRLDQRQAQAAVTQAEAELTRSQALLEQLRAGATPEQIAAAQAQLHAAQAQQRQAGGSVTAADRAAAQAQLAQAKARLTELQAGPKAADLRAAEALLAQAKAHLATQRDQLSAAKTHAELQMRQRASDLTAMQAAYVTAKSIWEHVQDNGEDPTTRMELNDVQQQQVRERYIQAETNLHNAEQAVEQARVAYDAARQAEVTGIQTAEQQLNAAQAALDKLKTGTSPAEIAAARAAVASSQAALDKLNGEQRGGTLEAAQAAVDQAQANLEQLGAGPSTSELAVAEASVQSAQAALKLAQVRVAETELHAPFAGTVAALDIRPGEYVTPGTPILQLADLSEWQIETTDLTEINIVSVQEGNQAIVSFDAIPDLELNGRVSQIRALGESKQGDITYAVIISLEKQDQRLRWNMTASVAIEP